MAKQSLLLVDGDTKSLRVLEVSLKKAGYNVTTASTGADALDKVSTAQPDLIISDTHMEGADGFEFCRQIKGNGDWATIPFIFLTNQDSIEHKIKGLELGVEDYLTKPIYIKEILTRVRILLQKTQRARLEEKREKRTRFTGHLADMGVVDLIQTVEVGAKSGVIFLTDDESGTKGTIYFRDGKVIDAELGHLHGEDAVYRMLTWSDGEFEFVFRNVRRKEVIKMSSQGLLMEGMRRLDEWGRLLEQLPELDARFVIDYEELRERLAELPDELNTMLRLFDGRRTLVEVIDDSEYGDLEGLEVISKLYFEGLIVESTDEDPAEDPAVDGWLASPTTRASGSMPAVPASLGISGSMAAVSPSGSMAAASTTAAQVAFAEALHSDASSTPQPSVSVPAVGLPAVSAGPGYTDHALPEGDLAALDQSWDGSEARAPGPGADSARATAAVVGAAGNAHDVEAGDAEAGDAEAGDAEAGDADDGNPDDAQFDELTPPARPSGARNGARAPRTSGVDVAAPDSESARAAPEPPPAAAGSAPVASAIASDGADLRTVHGEVDLDNQAEAPIERPGPARRMVTIEPSGARELPKAPGDPGSDRDTASVPAIGQPARPASRGRSERRSRAGVLILAAAVAVAVVALLTIFDVGAPPSRPAEAPATAPPNSPGALSPGPGSPAAAIPPGNLQERERPGDPRPGQRPVAGAGIDGGPAPGPGGATAGPGATERPGALDDSRPGAADADRRAAAGPEAPEASARPGRDRATPKRDRGDDKAERAAADSAAAGRGEVRASLSSARRAARRGKSAEALETVDRLLAADPGNGAALALKADLLLGMKKPGQALAVANEALKASSRIAAAWLTKGMAHYELEDYGLAKTSLARYLELRPRARNADEIRLLLETL